jgi:iron uptake system component EfeO
VDRSPDRSPPSGRARTLLAAVVAVVLTGCSASPADPPAPATSAVPISVRATDSTCDVSTPRAPAGTLTFIVTNAGTASTQFSLYGAGGQLVGEVQTIDPGTTRQLVVDVPDVGTYTTACRPGAVGDGIRAPFTVTGAARFVDTRAKLAEATVAYQRYVATQVAALTTRTRELADAVKARDLGRAKGIFPVAHSHYERIEPITRSFPDLELRLDGREDDQRDPGVAWTGFHRLEKDLWVDGLRPDSAPVTDRLVTDVADLQARTTTLQLGADRLADGATELLGEILTTKITGEEDRYAHTDLWDLKANVEGAQAVVAVLRPVIDEKDPTLGPVLDRRFAVLNGLIENDRIGAGFKSYTELTPDETKTMTDAIDALSEPISKVVGVITS